MFGNEFQKKYLKILEDRASEPEKKEFQNWLTSSEKNREDFNITTTVWNLFDQTALPEIPDAENEWKLLYNKLDLDNISLEKKKMVPGETNLLSSKIVRPVLTGVFIIIIATLITYFLVNSPQKDRWKTSNTFNKEQKEIVLLDGSIVQLNSKSSISYPENFSMKERKLILSGEAFFSVTKDKNRPFIVLTDNARTTVLGTKFNVCSRNEKTEVIVKEGLVNLSPLDAESKGINISKDEISFIDEDQKTHKPQKINSDYLIGWLKGNLVFVNTPLKDVIDELTRYYDIPVHINSEEVKNKGLSGSFNNKNIEEVLSMISLTYNLKFEKTNDGYILSNK